MGIADTPFLNACYRRNTGRLPVWVMRQAGRYLPEYQAVRENVSFQELCRSPELITRVVTQPLERFGFDAAILFSDILTMLEPMGARVTFPEGGPQISNPVRSADDVKAMRRITPETDLPFVLDGIREIKRHLPETPLIGFAGSPFTLSCYLIEGAGSKAFNLPKRFLFAEPEASEALFDLLVDCLSQYLRAQVEAGANAVQLFESWGGVLSYSAFQRWVVDPVTRIFESLEGANVPRILFVNNAAPYLDLVREVPCEVVGVDFRLPLRTAMDALPDKAIQGNLDPSLLFAGPKAVRNGTLEMLDSVTDLDRLIVNLGHGIQPETPIESVAAFVDTAHAYRCKS